MKKIILVSLLMMSMSSMADTVYNPLNLTPTQVQQFQQDNGNHQGGGNNGNGGGNQPSTVPLPSAGIFMTMSLFGLIGLLYKKKK